VIRVLLVDDHRIFREGVKRLLRETGDIVCVAEAADGSEATDRFREGGFDVAVLDVNLPHRNGFDVLACARKRWPDVRVIMLSMYPEAQCAADAFRAGAMAYLTKDTGLDELVGAIRLAAQGLRYAPARLADFLVDVEGSVAGLPPHQRLSARECQIFELIVGGRSLTDIADALHVSVSTVSTYRARVLEKLAAQSNAELVAYAIRNGLRH
jgi:two-component system invasion response regulator UvrY